MKPKKLVKNFLAASKNCLYLYIVLGIYNALLIKTFNLFEVSTSFNYVNNICLLKKHSKRIV